MIGITLTCSFFGNVPLLHMSTQYPGTSFHAFPRVSTTRDKRWGEKASAEASIVVLSLPLGAGSFVHSDKYCISGNFRVIKGSQEKIYRVKFSRYGPSTKIFNTWINVGEYGRDWCIRGCHICHETWGQLLEQLHHDGMCGQSRPEQSDYTACMAHLSH